MPARMIPAMLVALLISIPAIAQDINSELKVAAQNGQAEKVQALLEAGADANAKDENAMTALMWAAVGGDADTVQVLLDAGADASVKDKQGSTAQTWASGTEIIQLLKNSPKAVEQFQIGLKYFKGEGVPKDDAEAVKWYRKAAEQGYAVAQTNLGAMYAHGQGVSKDYAEALKWYRKAAEYGYDLAQNNLGAMYFNGEGVRQNHREAVKWYRQPNGSGLRPGSGRRSRSNGSPWPKHPTCPPRCRSA